MANIKQQIKRVRITERQRQRNLATRTRVRTFIKRAGQVLETGNADDAANAVRDAVREIDRAESKGVLHANSAARKKSALQRRLQKTA